jgi:hypothetical protein
MTYRKPINTKPSPYKAWKSMDSDFKSEPESQQGPDQDPPSICNVPNTIDIDLDRSPLTLDKTKYWPGPHPTTCDNCQKPIRTKFIHGDTNPNPSKQWHILCHTCHAKVGLPLSPTQGYAYHKDKDGEFYQRVSQQNRN